MPRALKPENLILNTEQIADILVSRPDLVEEYPMYKFHNVPYISGDIERVLTAQPKLIDYFNTDDITGISALTILEKQPSLLNKLLPCLWKLSDMEQIRGHMLTDRMLTSLIDSVDTYDKASKLVVAFPYMASKINFLNSNNIWLLIVKHERLIEHLDLNHLTGLGIAYILCFKPHLRDRLPIERIQKTDIAQIEHWNFTLFKLYITKLFQ